MVSSPKQRATRNIPSIPTAIVVTSTGGIHNGAVTHHQDQVITSVNFNVRKIKNTIKAQGEIATPSLNLSLRLFILGFFVRFNLMFYYLSNVFPKVVDGPTMNPQPPLDKSQPTILFSFVVHVWDRSQHDTDVFFSSGLAMSHPVTIVFTQLV